MMENDSVAMFLPEESGHKRQSCKPGRRFFCILALVAFLTLTVLFSVVLSLSVMNTNKYESLTKQYEDMRNKNEGKTDYSKSNTPLSTFIDKKINHSEFTWRREVNARFGGIDKNFRNQGKTIMKLRSNMNTSFETVTIDVEHLISTVDNLTSTLLRINSTSDHKIQNLRNILNDVKGDLTMTRTALTQINGSLRNDLTRVKKSMNLAVIALKNELTNLNSSTNEKTSELWNYWNKTNTEIEVALAKMMQQNASIHLEVKYQSTTLYSEVKKFEKKFAQLSNSTNIALKNNKQSLVNQLNKTRRILKESFQNQIAQTKLDLDKKLGSIKTQLTSSLAGVRTKVQAVKHQLQTNITNLIDKEENIEDDLSKTKHNLQGVDRIHETNISALAVKIRSITKAYGHLKDNLDAEKDKRLKLEKELQTVKSIVDKLQNKADGILSINTSLVVIQVSFILLYI
jgi:hypothetical protein